MASRNSLRLPDSRSSPRHGVPVGNLCRSDPSGPALEREGHFGEAVPGIALAGGVGGALHEAALVEAGEADGEADVVGDDLVAPADFPVFADFFSRSAGDIAHVRVAEAVARRIEADIADGQQDLVAAVGLEVE